MTTIYDLSPNHSVNTLPPAARDTLQATIAAHLDHTCPAVTLTVIQRGTVRVNAGWGWVDPEARTISAGPGTRFDLASVSKLFTATAFLSLLSAGRVRLDDPLDTVIPAFSASGPRPLDGGQDPHSGAMLPPAPESAGQSADPAAVTFRHLLTHTAGLAPWRAVYEVAGPLPPPPDQPDPTPRRERLRRALTALCGYPFVGQPGDGIVRYSDLGLMLLGEAVSRLHGTPGDLAAAVRERVLAPLGLSTLTYTPLFAGLPRARIAPTEIDRRWRGRRCWGEVHDENACGLGGVAGHAGLFGTARDVAAFGHAWLTGSDALAISAALRADATREQARTDDMRRGLGWQIKAPADSSAGDRFSPNSYGHTGFTGTSLWIDPSRDLVIALLTNRVYPGRDVPGIHALRRAVHDGIVQGLEE